MLPDTHGPLRRKVRKTDMKLAIFSGSTREGSINRKLERALVPMLEGEGFDVTVVSLADYPMPLYDGDWEGANGAPDSAKALGKLLAAQDAVMVVTPEYNGSLPPLLKNTIDWMTRIGDMSQYHNPIWAIAACTPGPMSGIMVMRQLQYILTRIGTQVLQFQLGVGNASTAFNEDGSLANQFFVDMAKKQIANLAKRAGQ